MSSTTPEQHCWFRRRSNQFVRALLAMSWCLVSLWAPVSTQTLVEDSEVPVEESREQESKESAESVDGIPLRNRVHRLSASSFAVLTAAVRVRSHQDSSLIGSSGHAYPNGVLAPLTC